MEKIYLDNLKNLEEISLGIPNTKMIALNKIHVFVNLNMRYERIMLNRNLETHPFILVDQLVKDAVSSLEAAKEIECYESEDRFLSKEISQMEDMHQNLFQMLWTAFDEDGYRSRIKRFEHRLVVNDLHTGLLEGKRIIDFGCGHGNFDHSFLNCGAKYVLGVDYGEESIAYARKGQKALGVDEDKLAFRHASVYDTGEADSTYDMAVQNGVFHHLDDEDRAYREVWRVLKPGGYFWVYTDGEGGIGYDLWDASRRALTEVPASLVAEYTKFFNFDDGKRYHIGDGLNAVYRHTNWNDLTKRLETLGFGDFRRLIGGFETDMDPDVVERDPWGKEKFGEGDIRLLCRKIG